MIQLPSIMEVLDRLAMSTTKTDERRILIRLLQLCASLDEQLLAWHEKLKTQIQGKVYWTVPSVADNPADDPALERVFPLAFRFPSLRIAHLLLFYWSMLILLYRTIQDIQKRLKRLKMQLTRATTMRYNFDVQDRDRSELRVEHNFPSDDRIALLANNISQSLEYCYRTKNGTLGPQVSIFPLLVAQSFYKSQPDRDRQLAWCSELGNMTAPDSRFDLYVIKFSEDGEAYARGYQRDMLLNKPLEGVSDRFLHGTLENLCAVAENCDLVALSDTLCDDRL
jgi:hypothetical protein